jgi:hypothetical protein
MENSSTKSEINCVEVVDKLGKLKVLFTEYESTLNSPDIRDDLSAALKLSEEVESGLLEMEEALPCPENILEIDRSINLIDFLTKPKTEGGLGIDWLDSENPIVESDVRNEGLTEIDLFKVRLDMSWLPEGKSSVLGVERLEALKAKSNEFIRLDLFVIASLWKLLKGSEEQKKEFENKLNIIAEVNGLKPDDLKEKYIFFDGTIIRSSQGFRGALFLLWGETGWRFTRNDLDNGWLGDLNPSLVLAM